MTISIYIYITLLSKTRLVEAAPIGTEIALTEGRLYPKFRLLERLLLYVSMSIKVTGSNTLRNQIQVASENALDSGFS